MSPSRRRFLRDLGAAGVGVSFITARGREGAGFWTEALAAETSGPIRPLVLSSNENPLGPGDKALRAVRDAFLGGKPGRYPMKQLEDLQAAIAALHHVKPENVVLGCGSTQILRSAAQLYTSPARPLVGSLPTYEECARYAELIGAPARSLPLDRDLRLDLGPMLDAAVGAGLVFFCNPNNPTATLHPAAAVDQFVESLRKKSPETTILIDEAYHDYVTDPAHRTQIPRAVQDPRVIVARTFSKAHGMAGLRIGYALAHSATARAMEEWHDASPVNILAAVGALASVEDAGRLGQEGARNAEARTFTRDFLASLGCPSTESQTNFLFVNLGRPAKGFREACLKQGVQVARDFPPLEKTHCRISIGTLAEMQRATEVFKAALSSPAA